MSNSAALLQGLHIKVAAVASRWQRVGDLIDSGIKAHTSHTMQRQTSGRSALKHMFLTAALAKALLHVADAKEMDSTNVITVMDLGISKKM